MTDWTPVSPGGPSWVPESVESADTSAAQSAAAAAVSAAQAASSAGAAAGSATSAQSAASSAGDTVATHAALTETHGVTGDIVGTTDAQTLTNKTLVAPVLGAASATSIALTGGGITNLPAPAANTDAARKQDIGTYSTAAALLAAFPSGTTIPDGATFVTAGRDAAADGGGATFRYDAGDTTTADNGGTVRVDGQGRRFKNAWQVLEPKLDFMRLIHRMKGFDVANQVASGVYVGDLSDVMQAAQDQVSTSGGGAILMGPGTYRMANIKARGGVCVEGVGNGYPPSGASNVQTTIQGNTTGIIFDASVTGATGDIMGVRFLKLNFIGAGAGTPLVGIKFDNDGTHRVGWSGAEHCSFWNFADQSIVDLGGDNLFDSIFAVGCLLNRTRATAAGVVELTKDSLIINSELGASQSAISPNYSVPTNAAPLCTAALMTTGADVRAVNCVLEFCDTGILVASGSSRGGKAVNCITSRCFAHGVIMDDEYHLDGYISDDGQGADDTFDGLFITDRARGCTVDNFQCVTPEGSVTRYRHAVQDNFPGAALSSSAHSFHNIRHIGGSQGAFLQATPYLGSIYKVQSRHVLLPGGATPSVDNNDLFEDAASSATDRTGFTDGVGAQKITIICYGNSTFKQGASLKLKTGADTTPVANTAISFVNSAGVWYEC